MKHLREEREREGISVDKLADAIGVHPNTIRGWERGDYEPTGKNLVQLTSLFGCSAEYLLDMTDERSNGKVAIR
jgi:transcriptional regulator with XRE-family HTH domain